MGGFDSGLDGANAAAGGFGGYAGYGGFGAFAGYGGGIELHCFDGVWSGGTETDVDCGGGDCAPCAPGSACAGNSDCTTGLCAWGTCVYPVEAGPPPPSDASSGPTDAPPSG